MLYGSDESLAQGFARHPDNRLLAELYRRHLTRIYSLARRYFRLREDAEEAVSETFLRCFRALRDSQFRGNSSFQTWLLRIAVNVCLERLRQPRLPTLLLDDYPEIPAPGAADLGLREALEQLPDDQRLAITLCDLEGYEAKEAAILLGRTVTATKSLHYRARRALRDLLEHDEP